MRKKPTFDELARASLAKSNFGPVELPYAPPNDASFAIAELREMTNTLGDQEIIGRNTQIAVQQTTDAAGASPNVIERMFAGSVAQTSNTMHNLVGQLEHAQAGQSWMQQLQHDALLKNSKLTYDRNW